MAVSSPLLETSINGAQGVLVNVTGSTDMGLEEVEIAANLVQEAAASRRPDHLRRHLRRDAWRTRSASPSSPPALMRPL